MKRYKYNHGDWVRFKRTGRIGEVLEDTPTIPGFAHVKWQGESDTVLIETIYIEHVTPKEIAQYRLKVEDHDKRTSHS